MMADVTMVIIDKPLMSCVYFLNERNFAASVALKATIIAV